MIYKSDAQDGWDSCRDAEGLWGAGLLPAGTWFNHWLSISGDCWCIMMARVVVVSTRILTCFDPGPRYSHVYKNQELMPSCRWSSSASSSFCSARSPSKVWSRLPNQSSWESSWPGQFLHRPAPHRPLRHRHLLLPQQLHLRENQQNLVTLWHLWST